MNSFSFQAPLRWTDIDSNGHLRHSIYYDLAVAARMKFLEERGMDSRSFEEFKLGHILFREEAIFRREIRLEDKILITVKMFKATEDFSKWFIRHEFIKEDGSIAAYVSVEGAWMDLTTRKLGKTIDSITQVFSQFPRTDDFEWIHSKKN
jgi:acyl-CoA thioester hydrolase